MSNPNPHAGLDAFLGEQLQHRIKVTTFAQTWYTGALTRLLDDSIVLSESGVAILIRKEAIVSIDLTGDSAPSSFI